MPTCYCMRVCVRVCYAYCTNLLSVSVEPGVEPGVEPVVEPVASVSGKKAVTSSSLQNWSSVTQFLITMAIGPLFSHPDLMTVYVWRTSLFLQHTHL